MKAGAVMGCVEARRQPMGLSLPSMISKSATTETPTCQSMPTRRPSSSSPTCRRLLFSRVRSSTDSSITQDAASPKSGPQDRSKEGTSSSSSPPPPSESKTAQSSPRPPASSPLKSTRNAAANATRMLAKRTRKLRTSRIIWTVIRTSGPRFWSRCRKRKPIPVKRRRTELACSAASSTRSSSGNLPSSRRRLRESVAKEYAPSSSQFNGSASHIRRPRTLVSPSSSRARNCAMAAKRAALWMGASLTGSTTSHTPSASCVSRFE